MVKKFSAPRGTSDIFPGEARLWQELETRARLRLACYGYNEIRPPFFEETDLFVRSVGQTSDIVQKQMLHLLPQSRAQVADAPHPVLSLRPEGTASVVRAYIQNGMDKKESLSKLFYIGPMFRGERPQKGRLRQFHQIGVEAIGPDSCSPYLDAETIRLALQILDDMEAGPYRLKLNTLGTVQDKENLSKSLRQRLTTSKKDLCADCQNRFDRNVFRVLDCKNKTCRQIVARLSMDDAHLEPSSRDYYQKVKSALKTLNIAFDEDPSMVRGLDYYTHTVFEICSSALGSQDALGAGGRYNNLVTQLGGPQADAVGFALGLERIMLARKEQEAAGVPPVDVFVISLDETSLASNFQLADILRARDMIVDMSFKTASVKSQMRIANKKGARLVVIAGEDEQRRGVVTLKNMRDGSQRQIARDACAREIKDLL